MNAIKNIQLIVGGHDLITQLVLKPTGVMVAIRPICEVIGVAPFSQQEKIRNDPRFNWHDIMSVAGDGKDREMFCLPVEQIVPWLFTINSNKLRKQEVKGALLAFQQHLGKELNAVAFGQLGSEETAQLKQMVSALTEQVYVLTKQMAKFQAALDEKDAKIDALTATNEGLWKARGFEGSAASYSMLAAKARKKAST